MNLDWAKNFTGELKIIFYDDLVKNVEESLRDILRFINYDINEVSKLSFLNLKHPFQKRLVPGFVKLRHVAKGRDFS